jgi:peptide deformylase
MVLPIRLYGDPVLRSKARKVTDFKTIPKLAQDMLETMYEARGVGLAAPQVGVSQRVFVWAEFDDEEEEGEEPRSKVIAEHVMVNPVLETLDGQLVEGLEGCLSIPGIYEEGVKRKRALRVNYQNERGEGKIIELEDFNARVIQHEFDHLEGKLFLDYLPKETLEKHRAELTKFQREAKAFLKEEQAKGKGRKAKGK